MRASLATIFLCLTQLVRADAIDDAVRARMRQLRLPGVAIAIVRGGEPAAIRTYGAANLELDVAVTPDTVFELGSVTKQFTAVAILMLAEEGKLALDESIARYLPDVPEAWRPITVRHLLTHSSGIQEYLSIPGLMDEAHAKTHEEMTRLFYERLKLEFAPGETWAYSNSGYLLLGHIIERLSGRSYWDFLDARVFKPLGMSRTRSSAPRALIRNRAAGYGWRDGAFENRGALSENAYSAGAIASTIRDVVRWEAALHGGKLLSKRGYEQMWTPLGVSRGPLPPFGYGFGWVVDRHRGRRVVVHSGGTPGFASVLYRYVDAGVSVIVLANHGDRILENLAIELAGLAEPSLARARAASDPDPALTERLESVLRDLFAGKHDPARFTPAMRLFLTTATGRGLWEWVGSHGALESLTFSERENLGAHSVVRYKADMGEAELWFRFTLTENGEIAQLYWW